jgi:hypothetical protein
VTQSGGILRSCVRKEELDVFESCITWMQWIVTHGWEGQPLLPSGQLIRKLPLHLQFFTRR